MYEKIILNSSKVIVIREKFENYDIELYVSIGQNRVLKNRGTTVEAFYEKIIQNIKFEGRNITVIGGRNIESIKKYIDSLKKDGCPDILKRSIFGFMNDELIKLN